MTGIPPNSKLPSRAGAQHAAHGGADCPSEGCPPFSGELLSRRSLRHRRARHLLLGALLLVTALQLGGCISPGAQTTAIAVLGSITWSGVPAVEGPHASASLPRSYQLAANSDIERSLVDALQTFEFSVNPSNMRATLDECETLAGDAPWIPLWTDGVTLDDDTLVALFNTSRKELRLKSSRTIIYQIRVLACYRIDSTFADKAMQDPQKTRTAVKFGERPKTNVELKMAIRLYKRKATDSFVEDTSSFRSSPIHKAVIERIKQYLERTPRTFEIDAESGGSHA